MIQVYSAISITAFILSVIAMVLAIILFFRFNILEIIGDLSGKNARKSIEEIRQKNKATGNKSHKPSMVNIRRGMTTEVIPKSIDNILDDMSLTDSDLFKQGNADIFPADRGNTGKISSQVTYVPTEKTELLNSSEAQKTELSNSTEFPAENPQNNPTVQETEQLNVRVNPQDTAGFKMIESIVFIHTDEVI